jgi:L-ascorbate metabolism protein UlaG (beta-lactamase superfamily)
MPRFRDFSAPRYQGPISDHFDGKRFLNESRVGHAKRWDIAKWLATRRPGPWKRVADAVPGPPPPARVAGASLRVTFVGHATVLVQTAGLNILTDPVWSERVSPVSFAGPRRVRPPGIRFEDLPPIDVVLISHNHYDHIDERTLRRLHATHRPRFVAPLGNAALLESFGLTNVVDLDWWESTGVHAGADAGASANANANANANETIHCVPAQHFSGRGLRDRDASLWGGFVLTGPGGVVYFAGDTGAGSQFARVREKFGSPRLALLPIGAYLPQWFMKSAHISPAEAVDAHRTLEATQSVAIHFGTFPLADDGRDEAPRDLQIALKQSGVATDEFWVLECGEGREVS